MTNLENLLKTKEMSDQLSDIDLKEKKRNYQWANAKERINNFEEVISATEVEIESLKTESHLEQLVKQKLTQHTGCCINGEMK